MGNRLTKRTVDAALSMDAIQFLWDGEIKGFALRVTPNGVKSYILQYRTEQGRSRRYTIGKHGSPWTPETARREAERLLRLVAEGQDPQASKQQARVVTPIDSFEAVAASFIERYAKPKNKAWTETKRLLDRDVIPVWKGKVLGDIRRRDVLDLLDQIVDSGRPVHANRVFAAIRKLFNWCIERDMLDANPCSGVKAPTEETGRDRVLSDDELRGVWRAAQRMGYPFGPFVSMLILTAQRRDEVAEMRWSEIDLGTGTWLLPKERTKNSLAHHVPLSPIAVELLRGLPCVNGSEFVFTTTGRTPISGFSGAKETLDALILNDLRKEAERTGQDPQTVSPSPPWRFHDLRRTVTTNLAAMGVPPHVADKILNHAEGTIRGVAAVYNRHAYIDERRQALNAWSDRLQQLTTPA